MRSFKKFITIFIVLLLCPFWGHTKAAGGPTWDEDQLVSSVLKYVNGLNTRTWEERQKEYKQVCKNRSEALRRFLCNEMFLLADVTLYVRELGVGSDSHEGKGLIEIAAMSQTKDSWKDHIRALIGVYERISAPIAVDNVFNRVNRIKIDFAR